jgi:hypothetical protein
MVSLLITAPARAFMMSTEQAAKPYDPHQRTRARAMR